jgi:thiosulfate/3-mercaptopyruvate sulfurtransferase
MEPLVSAGWLLRHLAEVRPVDTRWVLTEPGRGRATYDAGHLPGAVFADIDSDLSELGKPGPGRHPLPEGRRFAATMSRLGIGDDTRVVAYDGQGGVDAARLWWLLLFHGHERAQILDGGVAAWLAAGGTLTDEKTVVAPADFHSRPPLVQAVDRAYVQRTLGRALLLDARARERYEGRVEPIDPRAGHIPGARSAPFAENLDPQGRMRPAAELRERYAALGALDASEVICYCGSGVTACHDVLALVVAGRKAPLLYEGSWSDWSRDPALPAELGPEKKER